MTLYIVYAQSKNGKFGKDNELPWSSVPEDLKTFRKLTLHQNVVMGRRTWESLPIRPLPYRYNFVISTTMMPEKDVVVMRSLQDYFDLESNKKTWVIGGKSLIEQCFKHATEVHRTIIEQVTDGDIDAPDIPLDLFRLESSLPIYDYNEKLVMTYQVFKNVIA